MLFLKLSLSDVDTYKIAGDPLFYMCIFIKFYGVCSLKKKWDRYYYKIDKAPSLTSLSQSK